MRKVALSLIAFVFLSSLLYAQQKAHQRTVKTASIDFGGVELQLGMSRADAAERLIGAQITKESDDSWFIGKTGSVRFKNNRLIYADKSWINEDTDRPLNADDVTEAIFKAVGSLNRQGFSICRVSYDVPDAGQKGYTRDGQETDIPSRAQRVWIDCGEKGVRILTVSNSASSKVIDVAEVLGAYTLN